VFYIRTVTYHASWQVVLYDLFKRMLGPGPTYATLGNHDTCLPDQASPLSLGGALGQQFSWYSFSHQFPFYTLPHLLGYTTTLQRYGSRRDGFRRLPSSFRVLTMQRTWSSVQMA